MLVFVSFTFINIAYPIGVLEVKSAWIRKVSNLGACKPWYHDMIPICANITQNEVGFPKSQNFSSYENKWSSPLDLASCIAKRLSHSISHFATIIYHPHLYIHLSQLSAIWNSSGQTCWYKRSVSDICNEMVLDTPWVHSQVSFGANLFGPVDPTQTKL